VVETALGPVRENDGHKLLIFPERYAEVMEIKAIFDHRD
jgi:hypothetical protein